MKPPIITLNEMDQQKILFYALYEEGYRWDRTDSVDDAWRKWTMTGSAKAFPCMYLYSFDYSRKGFTARGAEDSINVQYEIMNSIPHFISYLRRWEKTQE